MALSSLTTITISALQKTINTASKRSDRQDHNLLRAPNLSDRRPGRLYKTWSHIRGDDSSPAVESAEEPGNWGAQFQKMAYKKSDQPSASGPSSGPAMPIPGRKTKVFRVNEEGFPMARMEGPFQDFDESATLIDGSFFEGGGQVVRNAMALSAITGQNLRISDVRANRRPSGLAYQHCTGVELVTTICSGAAGGAEVGATEVRLQPGRITPGHYVADPGTAGATALLAQAALPCLLLAGALEERGAEELEGEGKRKGAEGSRDGREFEGGTRRDEGAESRSRGGELEFTEGDRRKDGGERGTEVEEKGRLKNTEIGGVDSKSRTSNKAQLDSAEVVRRQDGAERSGREAAESVHLVEYAEASEQEEAGPSGSVVGEKEIIRGGSAREGGSYSSLLLRGGTDASKAPPIDYAKEVLFPMMKRLLGVEVDMKVKRRGFYPKGNGELTVTITKTVERGQSLPAFTLTERGAVVRVHVRAFTAGALPQHVANEMMQSAKAVLDAFFSSPGFPSPSLPTIHFEAVRETPDSAFGNGAGILLLAETSTGCLLAGSRVLERGQRGADAGREAAKDLVGDLRSGGCVDRYLQDQLVIFMAAAEGTSRLLIGKPTLHTCTAVWVAESLTAARFRLLTADGESAMQLLKEPTGGHNEFGDPGTECWILECDGAALKA